LRIPIPFTYHRETTPAFPDLGPRRWRWVLAIAPTHLFVEEEVFFDKTSHDWRGPLRHAGVSINRKHIHFGSQHIWYDHPWCSFSLGIIHFAWYLGGNCKKCNPDPER
jgi:hypothetical protein